MPPANPVKPRVFIDADVLFAGSAGPSQHGASLIILRMAEITLVEALTSQQVITEVERNLAEKIPAALPALRLLVSRCLTVVPDPTAADLLPCSGLSNTKDLPILVAARRENCAWLVTFNVRHFQPDIPEVNVLRPGEVVMQVRHLLTLLSSQA